MKKSLKNIRTAFLVIGSLALLFLMVLFPYALIQSLGDDKSENLGRAAIEAKAFTKGITNNSFDAYYSAHGLVGTTEYLAFSLPKDELWPVALKTSKLKKENFVKEITLEGPHTWNQKETKMFLPKKSHNAWQGDFILNDGIRSTIVVNEDDNRLYFRMVSSD